MQLKTTNATQVRWALPHPLLPANNGAGSPDGSGEHGQRTHLNMRPDSLLAVPATSTSATQDPCPPHHLLLPVHMSVLTHFTLKSIDIQRPDLRHGNRNILLHSL